MNINPNYKILSVKYPHNDKIHTVRSNGRYVYAGIESDNSGFKNYTLEYEINKHNYEPYSISTKSGNETYTVGDVVFFKYLGKITKCVIQGFKILHSGNISVKLDGYPSVGMHFIFKLPVLFTTEDGVDIYEH